MGDPKRSRRQFTRPSKRWDGERIKSENEIIKKYGLKSKKEVWKADSELRSIRRQARTLMGKLRTGDPQAQREEKDMLNRLNREGIIAPNASIADVLFISMEDLLARRLQTMVMMKGYAHNANQARQFIVHGHISVNGRRITIPGYKVPVSEEDAISYSARSPMNDEDHPMRPRPEAAVPEPLDAPEETRGDRK